MAVATGTGIGFRHRTNKSICRGREKSLPPSNAPSAGARTRARPLLAPVQAEIAVATAEDDIGPSPVPDSDPLFRLHTKRWAADDDDLLALFPRPRSAGASDRVRRGRVDLPHDACRRSPVEAARPGAQLPGRLRAIGRRCAENRFSSRRGSPNFSKTATVPVASPRFSIIAIATGGSTGTLDAACIGELLLCGLVSLHDRRLDPQRRAVRRAARIEVRSSSRPVEVHA